MTDEQKKTVARLRRGGKTPSEIAQRLGLTVNAVRIYCSRNGLTDEALRDRRFCEQCSRPLPIETGKKRRFCSDACRMRWWNAHPELVHRKAFYTATCHACGKEFASYGNSHRKYCSRGCYLAGRYGRDMTPNV